MPYYLRGATLFLTLLLPRKICILVMSGRFESLRAMGQQKSLILAEQSKTVNLLQLLLWLALTVRVQSVSIRALLNGELQS
jgi:hypothetical protein